MMVTIPKSLQPPPKAKTIASLSITPVTKKQITATTPEESKPKPQSIDELAYNKAVEYIERKSQGKRANLILFELGDDEVRPITRKYFYELMSDPKIREAFERGQEVRGMARQKGFENVQEFAGVSQFFSKDLPPRPKYIDELGQGVSMADEVFEAMQKGEPLPKLSSIKKEELPEKRAVFNVVSLPESKSETYQRYIKEEGKVRGTLGFFGDYISALESRGQTRAVKEYGGSYDPQFSKVVGGTAELIPYATPLAPAILFGQGVEDLSRYQTNVKRYQDEGYTETQAKALSLGIPIFETGLGVAGLKSQVETQVLKQQVKKAETQFFSEIVRGDKISSIDTFGTTKIGDNTIYSLSRGYSLEGGSASQGFVFYPEGQGGKVSTIYSLGKGKNLGEARFIKNIYRGELQPKGFGFDKIKEPLSFKDPIELSFGKAQGVSSKNLYQLGKQDPKMSEIIGGIQRVGKTDFYRFAGGRPSSVRIYREGGIKLRTRGEVTGRIKVTDKPPKVEDRGFSSYYPSGSKSKTLTAQEEKQVSESVGSLIAGVTEVKGEAVSGLVTSTPSGLGVLGGTLSQEPKTRQKRDFSYSVLNSFALSNQSRTKGAVKESSKEKQKLGSLLSPIVTDVFDTRSNQDFRVTTIPRPATKTQQTQTNRPFFNFFFVGEPIPQPTTPKAPTGLILPRLPEKKLSQRAQGFYAYAREGKSWTKLTKKPHTRSGALDKMARFVDENLSARGKIAPAKASERMQKKSKGLLGSQLKKGDGYFSRNQYKFRPYRITQGRKVGINSWIEKEPYRLDSPKERKNIQSARQLSKTPFYNGLTSLNSRRKGKRRFFL